jgi:N-acetylglucosaminyldiphosphoundecaprenol N-acetyl-beta-D-mannosaminyltransferase
MRKLLIVLGIPIDNVTMEETLDRCDEFIADGRASGRTYQIATVNADFVVNSLHDPELRRILQEADMSTADGMPLVWASRLLGGPLKDRVTGADLVPALAERAAAKGYSIFFLGARPGVAAQAAAILQQRNPGLKVAGICSPPPSSVFEMDPTVVEQIKAARPDILLVAFGNPKQEKWIRMYAPDLPVSIAIGIGGTLDMIVGVTKRAPIWMQRSGLEWLYRLSQEPKRLVKRYIHDFGYFGYFFVRQWWAMRQGTAINMAPLPAVSPGPATLPAAPEAPIAPTPEAPIAPAPEAPRQNLMPVLRPQGRIDVATHNLLGEQVRAALSSDAYVVVNLAEVSFIDSTGLGTLVALANQARSAGGALYLVEVPEPVLKLIALVRLDLFFEILPDAPTAEQKRVIPATTAEPRSVAGGWIIVRSPRLFETQHAGTFIERCTQALAEQPRLVVDLSETVFLASAGIASLLKLDRQAREQGGELRVAGGTSDVLRTIKLVRVDQILQLFPSVQAALAQSQTPAGGPPDRSNIAISAGQ